jgi:hypothetical protein
MSVESWRLHNLINDFVVHYRAIDFLGTVLLSAPKLPADDIDSTQSKVAMPERTTIDTTEETFILAFGPDMLCSVLEPDVLPRHACALGLSKSLS